VTCFPHVKKRNGASASSIQQVANLTRRLPKDEEQRGANADEPHSSGCVAPADVQGVEVVERVARDVQPDGIVPLGDEVGCGC